MVGASKGQLGDSIAIFSDSSADGFVPKKNQKSSKNQIEIEQNPIETEGDLHTSSPIEDAR